MPEPRPDLARLVFGVLFLCTLLIASLWILAPFIAAIVWATTIVVATWPILLALEKRLGGKRSLATAGMTLVLLGIVFVPFLAAIGALLGCANELMEEARTIRTMEVPPPPDRVGRLPLVGARAAAAWQGFAGEGVKEFAATFTPYGKQILKWFVTSAGSAGAALAQFLLTIVVTAVGQAVVGGIGLAIAGIPFAGILTAVMFILCIAQIGPILVLAPAVIWLYSTGRPGFGTFLLVWTLIVGTIDNVARPILIRKGADLPLLLIFAGVIGGFITLGLIGIFVGPVVLAVAHTLMEAWLGEAGAEELAGG